MVGGPYDWGTKRWGHTMAFLIAFHLHNFTLKLINNYLKTLRRTVFGNEPKTLDTNLFISQQIVRN